MTDHRLPPGVPAGGPDVPDDPDEAERRAVAMLRRTGDEIVAGVEGALPAWARREAERIVDAWGRHDADERRATLDRAEEAGRVAATRVAGELGVLMALDPDEQAATPLQVVRTAVREVTAVLRDAGIPPVERDGFAERALPDDGYGLAPETLADLGDDDLAPLHLAWGVAKATVHRARHGGA